MNVNIIPVIALIIILALAGLGFKRGLIMSIWHLVSMIVILGVTIFLSPYVAKFAKSNEKIHNTVYQTMEKTVNIPAKSGDDIEKFIKDWKLPEKVEETVLKAASKYYGDAEDAQKSFADGVHEKLTDAVLTAVSFLLTFLIVTIVSSFILKALDLASKLPVVNAVNKLGGILLGAAEGILIVWALVGIATMTSMTETGAKIVEQIQANKYLKILYDHNIFSTLLSGTIFKIFK